MINTKASSCYTFITGLLLLISSTNLSGQSFFKYNVEKVTNDIYVLKPQISEYRWVTANIVVVINESDVLVVDSGFLPAAADEAIKEIKKLTPKPVKYLVNTHWHGDHWQGNESFVKAFPNVEIIATEQGLKGIKRNGMVWVEQLYNRYLQNYLEGYEKAVIEKSIDGKPMTDAQVEELKAAIVQVKQDIASVKQLKPVFPSVTYSDKMVLNKGQRDIQLLYFGVGNTSGDAVVYLPKEKVLITGDLVVHPSPYESGMFSPEWLEVSKKVGELDYQLLIPGHGDVQKDHHYLDFLNAFFEEIIKQVGQAYVNGKTKVDDIKLVVTHQSVMDELNKTAAYREFTKNLENDFVPAAINTSFKRIMQGKQ
jgi:cyclase